MAIDRVTPSSAALNIPDRTAREQPGQAHVVPPVPQPPEDGPHFALNAGVPAAVGALIDAMDGKLAATVPAALTGKVAAEALLGDTLSMQPNQLFMSRQLVTHPPDTSVMAASWMAMVRTYAEQRAALMQQTEGRHVPASLFLSDQAPAMLRDGRVPPQLVSELDAWRFAVYAWGAEKLVLRVVALDPDEEDGAAPRRRRARAALRLEVHVPDLGKIVLQMEPGDDGVMLEIAAAQEGAMRHIRKLLPRIGAIATGCGVRFARVRLMRELAAPGTQQPTASQVAFLTPAMFKTMAEVAVLLSQPLPADELFFEPQN
ncbi:hypothetical protein IP92_05976 [Pseudoduganella flava]|uniref:Flagellar hook-length control protein FliK n=1 Tax=Pseudoduganella flava TaxID=871742 RepID=A0A562P4I7_9BURK|nr:hypothetical protein [Pseudoduganella flava]QGZ38419.1 hypothetical protein GO485_04700 [Pseudoduganella flava]TWI39271.1 hypothetical protein IP92_05976 [Pseudoduganella flava]